jgi:hypothetical protein
MSRFRISAVGSLIAMLVPLAAHAQAKSAATSAMVVRDSLTRRTVASPIFGDAVIVVNLRSDDRIELAASDPKHTGAVALPVAVASRWTDSVRRVLAYRGTRPKSGTKTYRVFGEEPELAGGGLTLTRRDTKDSVSYSVFFADSTFGGFAVPLTARDVRVLSTGITRAIAERERLRKAAAQPKRKSG